MNANEITKIIENSPEYNRFGIRAMTMNPVTNEFEIAKVGESISYSYNWSDGDSTGEKLNGASALEVNAENVADVLEAVRQYDDRSQVVLLGSLRSDYGQDSGEIIMHGNLTVLGIIA